jgi:hypothetical protein
VTDGRHGGWQETLLDIEGHWWVTRNMSFGQYAAVTDKGSKTLLIVLVADEGHR